MLHRIHFFSPKTLEEWDYQSAETKGVGGSETAVIELSKRLARRGHNVTVYAPVPCFKVDQWQHSDTADFTQPGIWIVCRSPSTLDNFGFRSDQRIWLQCQDVDYREALTPDRAAKCERVLALCPTHREHLLTKYPFLTPDQVVVTSNGISSDRIAKLPPQERDPYRLIWTSSPERNLSEMLQIFARAREFEPRLNLHVFYGWQGIDRMMEIDKGNAHWKRLKESILSQPQAGVTWHERVSQPQLWAEYQKSNIWCYGTQFQETSCINCMEAQAFGAIPICPPLWALAYNVAHGMSIRGLPTEPMTRARYVKAILDLVANPELCEQIRKPMIPWALQKFDWDKVVDQHIYLVESTELVCC